MLWWNALFTRCSLVPQNPNLSAVGAHSGTTAAVGSGGRQEEPSRHTFTAKPNSQSDVQSRDPKLAADFANSMSETFIEQSIEARWNAAQQIREWLRPQVEELRVKLEKAEEELQSYSRKSGVIVTSAQETLAEDRLRSVQGELTKAQPNASPRSLCSNRQKTVAKREWKTIR
jgi:hypothetical protein